MTGYRARHLSKNGKRPIVFTAGAGFLDRPITIACGQCIGCRLERSRQWAMRCIHESQLHNENCFITLTYSDEHIPAGASLDLTDFQKFMKRLRKSLNKKIRFFHCGEYGEASKNNNYIARPHYHAAIFGHTFEDVVYWKKSPSGIPVYRSDTLDGLWPLGWAAVGELNFESAAYIARYIVDKVNGDKAAEHYHGRKPEYITMSRRPGIAADWYDKFKDDVFPSDNIHVRGKKMLPPKFYTKRLELDDPLVHENIKRERLKRSLLFKKDNTYERLYVREIVRKASINLLKRNHEEL